MRLSILAALALSGCTGSAAIGQLPGIITQAGAAPDQVCVGILQQSAQGLASLKATLNGTPVPPAVP